MRKIRVVYIITRFKKAGPINQTYNIIKHLDREKFEPIVVTCFKEVEDDTLIHMYEGANIKHICLELKKHEMILNNNNKLNKLLSQLEPDIIQSVGMGPYKLSLEYKEAKKFVTIRNYFEEDYPSKYGKLFGKMLAKKDLATIKKLPHNITCSRSLSEMYEKEHGISLPFIRNGVDGDKYSPRKKINISELRKKLLLPKDKTIAIYTGQFVDRKNQEFAIKAFISKKLKSDFCLVLLGKGPNLTQLQEKYGDFSNIIFKGEVDNVEEFLQASDFYISTSKSEGLPNGVLEAMSVGLPVVLSDILQHKEVYEIDERVGELYIEDNAQSLIEAITKVTTEDLVKNGKFSQDVIKMHLNAQIMSKLYQEKYLRLYKKL